MFDTHCHLNFSAFESRVKEVVKAAAEVGVHSILIPGTDVETSRKAVIIAERFENVYAAVGIHPHHVYEIQNAKCKNQNDNPKSKIKNFIKEIESLLSIQKVVAVGEIGLDRHDYQKTKHEHYHIDDKLIAFQKECFIGQLQLAKQYHKSVIIHNREAKDDLLAILAKHWDDCFVGRMVFHCCEPDDDLLQFAVKHQIFIGVDGDITYRKDKQEFVKKAPLELLVLETDSPFLLPEPLKSQKLFPNVSANLVIIQKYLAGLLDREEAEIAEITEENSRLLFRL